MKVIHFPTSTGGMSWELAQGEKNWVWIPAFFTKTVIGWSTHAILL